MKPLYSKIPKWFELSTGNGCEQYGYGEENGNGYGYTFGYVYGNADKDDYGDDYGDDHPCYEYGDDKDATKLDPLIALALKVDFRV